MTTASGLQAPPGPDRASTGTQALHATDFISAKRARRRLSIVTCYDYTFARILNDTPVDALLVGDSAAMVMHGHPSTIYADIEMMATHTEAVVRGAPKKFVIADMPFLTVRKGLTLAMDAAQLLMRAGAHALKIEGVDGHDEIIGHLVQSGIPIMGHLGLQPQSIHATGGYRVQGQGDEAARSLMRQAQLLQLIGAFGVVLECVPRGLAREITDAVQIPTIGIGAGAECDGQVLVLHDLLGMNSDFHPRFARVFADLGTAVSEACAEFDRAAKTGTFPTREESYE